MVGACLRVVLDDEDDRVSPKWRLRKRLHDAAEREIVVCHVSLWRWITCARSRCVVSWEMHDLETRHVAVLGKLLELRDPGICPSLIWNTKIEWRVFRADVRSQVALGHRPTLRFYHLAVVAKTDPLLSRQVPKEAVQWLVDLVTVHV